MLMHKQGKSNSTRIYTVLLLILIVPVFIFARGGTEMPESEPQESAIERSEMLLPAQTVPSLISRGFTTDFTRSTISFAEILSGGPGKDGIPSIDNPGFESLESASSWLADDEAVLVVSIGGISRVYPLQILMWHEIVNDDLDGNLVAVTWCPLCNTSLVFNRVLTREDGTSTTLDFGTTGRLRFSNLLMYDRQSESWWQQADGRAVIGSYAGRTLEILPSFYTSFAQARRSFPDADVLSRPSGTGRSYGTNPYTGYDSLAEPFLYQGPPIDGSLPLLERVVVLPRDGSNIAIPYSAVRSDGIVRVPSDDGRQILLFYSEGISSPLDRRSTSGASDAGGVNAFYSNTLDGTEVSFSTIERGALAGSYIDDQGTLWDANGFGASGPGTGMQLEPAVGIQNFWFSAAAFEAIRGENLGF